MCEIKTRNDLPPGLSTAPSCLVNPFLCKSHIFLSTQMLNFHFTPGANIRTFQAQCDKELLEKRHFCTFACSHLQLLFGRHMHPLPLCFQCFCAKCNAVVYSNKAMHCYALQLHLRGRAVCLFPTLQVLQYCKTYVSHILIKL